MASLIDTGIVNAFNLEVYEREMERYGEDIIEYLEKAFFAGTCLIIRFFGQVPPGGDEDERLQLAYGSLDMLMDCFTCSLEDKMRLFERFYRGMAAEFNISGEVKEQLRKKFREIREAGTFRPADQVMNQFRLTAEAEYFRFAHGEVYRFVRESCPERTTGLLGDIIHMHLNRLFVTSQRKNELVIYYCLWRHYASEAGRPGAALSGPFADQYRVEESQ